MTVSPTRSYFSEHDRAEVWRRWKEGESLAAIGRALNRRAPSIYYILSKSGGVKQPPKKRSRMHLTMSEREEISRGIVQHKSIRSIAKNLGRAPSSISREIRRNGGISHYRAHASDKKAWERAKRPKPCKLYLKPKLRKIVALKLKEFWSPEQIAGWLKLNNSENQDLRISHETIYKSLYIQTRGVLKKELLKHLRSKPRLRGARTKTTERRGFIQELVSIKDRPKSVEDRAIPGHWEGDLIEGSGKSYIATLVERQTRYVCLVKIDSKSTDGVINQLVKHAKSLPSKLYKSLTWDRGTELRGHQNFTRRTKIDVYFCDPQSPWQRGTNENTNRLLRQYFPKRTGLAKYSQKELNQVANKLNNRPRKTLGYHTPAEKFKELRRVALTD
jgi:IS30 family transposase